MVSGDVFSFVLPARNSYLAEHKPLPNVAEMEHGLKRCFHQCRERGIELKIVIPPVHSVFIERMCQLGLSDRIEMGKRVLVRLASEANLIAINSKPIEVWDFTAFAGPTTETYPTPATSKEMHWYHDAQHFRRSLGDRVLDQILNFPSELPAFGTLLTDSNIETHLVANRAARDAYRRIHADHVQLALEGPIERH